MQSAIRIQPEGNHINVWCTFNEDIVRIFQEHNGWWRPKTKSWMFPLSVKDTLTSVLEEAGYKVLNVSPYNAWRKTTKLEFSYDKPQKTKQEWGLCRNCKSKAFIDKDCLCEKCKY